MPKKTKSSTKKDLPDQLEELQQKYQRSLADYQNLVKQTTKEKQEFAKYSNHALISQLLPLIDNLEQAAAHIKDDGLNMIIAQFQQLLRTEGIEPIYPQLGDAFDHSLHECLETIEDSSTPPNTLAEISLKGYKYISGRVIRPAKVKVYQTK